MRTWERKFAEFVERFPMYEESREAPADIFFADNVAHSEKISSQCQDLPSSPFISRLSSLQCHLLTRHTPHLRLGPLKLETLSQSRRGGSARPPDPGPVPGDEGQRQGQDEGDALHFGRGRSAEEHVQ